MTLALSKKTWLGVAREATSGTAITTPTQYVPTKSNIKAMRKQEILNEERGDVNEEYDAIPTIRFADWDVKGPFYPDAHTYFLIAALGGVSSAQPASGTDPNVWKHTLSLADVPPSLTLHKSEGAQFYYSPYSVLEKFSLKFDAPGGKLVEFDASGKGIWPVINGTPPTPAFSQVQPFAGYAPTLTLFGAATTDIIDLQIDYERKWTLWNPANGSQDYVTAYPGGRKIGLSFTARFDTDTLYQRYKTQAYDTFTFDVLGPIISHAYAYELNIGCPVIFYESMEHDKGKDNVLIKAKARVLATKQTINSVAKDGTGNNLINMYVQNTTTGYTV